MSAACLTLYHDPKPSLGMAQNITTYSSKHEMQFKVSLYKERKQLLGIGMGERHEYVHGERLVLVREGDAEV